MLVHPVWFTCYVNVDVFSGLGVMSMLVYSVWFRCYVNVGVLYVVEVLCQCWCILCGSHVMSMLMYSVV